MEDDYQRRLRHHLTHEHARNLLMEAGLLLLAKDLVTSAVVDDVKSFFCDDMDENLRPIASDTYMAEVRDHGRKQEFAGSVDWLVSAGVLTDEHLATIEQLQFERNRVAHEALALLVDPEFNLDRRPLLGAAEVLRAIGVFFGRLHVDADAQYDRQEIADEDIQSGKSVAYAYALSATGDLFSSEH